MRHNMSMDIYIKLLKKVSISSIGHIRVGHVCDVQAPADVRERIERLKLVATDQDAKKKTYLVSVLDVIKIIDQSLPGHTVNNVGEMDTIIMYTGSKKKEFASLKWLKIIAISLIFAIGSASAIMSFHNDAELPKVFSAYHRMFTGEENNNPRTLQISYIIGIAVGIIAFFSHFGGKSISNDPSPIEIEMSDYDNTVTETLTEFLAAKNSAKGDNHGDP